MCIKDKKINVEPSMLQTCNSDMKSFDICYEIAFVWALRNR